MVVNTFPFESYAPVVMLPSLLLRKMLPFWIVPVVFPLGSVRNTFPSLIVPNVISPLPVLIKTFPFLKVNVPVADRSGCLVTVRVVDEHGYTLLGKQRTGRE